ncbi:Choline-sulfatase [Pontiella desulfatans]|uniref:Choline-sulfatase n=1 Tax=Pontiella desulfatans TaxID=2750659 RepID=A0A6C2U5F2_PONDE|nr:sulfatase [Pontiella desulfatans]SPS73953.1 sulfatase S1_7 [Kiritimatiellales bacterium]VGO15135.1 Choline-sulfatase [Pontiella desulfatans]
MKKLICILGFALAAGFAVAKSSLPNILFIPIDDLKPVLGCFGDEIIQTPNIDRLAERGTVFLNTACQQALCGPSRASIMTGLYPDQTGVWDLETKMRDVDPDVLTLPQYFRQQGYATTGLGKTFDPRCVDNRTDLDAPSWSIPYGSVSAERSMDHYQDYVNPMTIEAGQKAEAQLAGKVFNPGYLKNRAMAEIGGPLARPATECMDVPDDAYPDGALANAAVQMLDRLAAGDKPFFLSVGFHKPHLPFVAPKKYWDLYDRDEIDLAAFRNPPKGAPMIAMKGTGGNGELGQYSDIPREDDLPVELQKRLIHGYMATVSYMDAQLGKVLDHLEKAGLAENTVICFWGDHGFHLGDHKLWTKHTNFEQAVRSPLIIAGPKGLSGNTSQSPAEFVDVFPTLCELAGLDIPEHLPGKSLVPIMKDPTALVRPDAMAQYTRGSTMGYTLRDERHRYVKWLKMDYRKGERTGVLVAKELYDYKTDPLETKNLVDDPEYHEVVKAFEKSFKIRGVAQENKVK